MKPPFWPYPLSPEHPRNRHEAGFWKIHSLYPAIYIRIDARAHTLLAAGVTHYGLKSFFESIRWHTGLSMDPPEVFKMNNDYPAYYARFWLQNNPAHWDFFELRKVKGEYPQAQPPPWNFNGSAQGELF